MFAFKINNIVEIKMSDNQLTYIIILPGIAKDKVNVSISNTKLSVETTEKTAFGEKFVYNDEYDYSKKYLVAKATSKLLDGVLTISIPAKQQEKDKVRQITIE